MNERLSVPEAARRLGITEGALRQRINRGTIEHEKDAEGRVYVFIHSVNNVQHGVESVSVLVESLQDQVQYLRRQLDAEREANRENRRLLAAALERIPAIEAPEEASAEPPESPQTASEDVGDTRVPPEPERRSWWRRWIGG